MSVNRWVVCSSLGRRLHLGGRGGNHHRSIHPMPNMDEMHGIHELKKVEFN